MSCGPVASPDLYMSCRPDNSPGLFSVRLFTFQYQNHVLLLIDYAFMHNACKVCLWRLADTRLWTFLKGEPRARLWKLQSGRTKSFSKKHVYIFQRALCTSVLLIDEAGRMQWSELSGNRRAREPPWHFICGEAHRPAECTWHQMQAGGSLPTNVIRTILIWIHLLTVCKWKPVGSIMEIRCCYVYPLKVNRKHWLMDSMYTRIE